MLYSTTISYIGWSKNNENSAHINNTLFVTLLLLLLLLLIVIYDCDGKYVQGNDKSGLLCWSYLLNLLSRLFQSVPPRINTTQLFQAYTYDWVMLLIVPYDGIMKVQGYR